MLLACLFYFRLTLHEALIVIFYASMNIFFIFRLTLYQAYMKPLKYILYESVYNIFLILFLIGFISIIAYKHFLIVFISMGAGLLLTEIAHFFFMIDPVFKIDIRHIHLNKRFTKKIMDYGMPLTIWIFISTVMMMADRYIIKEFDGYGAAGTYSAIKDIVIKISTFAIMPIFIAYNSKINDAWNSKDRLRARSLLREVLAIELVVGVLVCIGFLIFSRSIYSGILHLKGERLVFTSVFLIISAFLWQAAMFFHKPMELLYRQKTMVILIVISLAVNIILNLVLVPGYGYPAAAVNAFVSVSFYSLLSYVLSRRMLRGHLAQQEEPL
jgi:O-antigen/teichoic acid export membrane protein